MVNVVNIVASGSLNTEIDLEVLAAELDRIVEYDPIKHPGAYIRFDKSSPLITLYRTGKYIITGASSEEQVGATRDKLLTLLSDYGVLSETSDGWFEVQNYVCIANIDKQLNLSALAIGLGLEFTEYEPEQFAGLVYRPPEFNCVLLIMSSGKMIITGTDRVEVANNAFMSFREKARKFF